MLERWRQDRWGVEIRLVQEGVLDDEMTQHARDGRSTRREVAGATDFDVVHTRTIHTRRRRWQ
jgi:hypothetical protein